LARAQGNHMLVIVAYARILAEQTATVVFKNWE
jgi:hypothetical protein